MIPEVPCMYTGILLCLVFGVLATWLGGLQHFIGGPMIGLFLGVIVANLAPALVAKTRKGAQFCSKILLKVGIILAGGTLSFTAVLGAGLTALPMAAFNICLSFAAAILVGKWLKVTFKSSVLVGGGTAICGGTAIATLTPIVEADEEDMAYAMTAIFLFDIIACLMWPYLGIALDLNPMQYGVLSGLAINDASSVAAAAVTFDTLSNGATSVINGAATTGGDIAIIVKLTRTVLLVFVALAVSIIKTVNASKKAAAGESGAKISVGKQVARAFPLFVLGFLALAVVNTVVDFSSIQLGALTLKTLLNKVYKYLFTVALVGVGYKINVKDLFTKGVRPVLLGGCTWVVLSVVTVCFVLFLL